MSVPKLVLESWNRVNKRIDEFCNNSRDNAFVCLFITDVHAASDRTNIEEVTNLKELLKLNNVDFLINGGDIGVGLEGNKELALETVNAYKDAMNFDIPHIYIKGNHDRNSELMSNKQFISTINESVTPYLNNNFKIIYDEVYGGGYGYYVDTKTSTKIIFLNTSECENSAYEMSDNQLNFVINTLTSAKEKNIILVSHKLPDEESDWIGDTNNFRGLKILELIECDFMNKKSGSYENLSWDFTNAKSTIVLALAGDAHFNNSTVKNGFVAACRQGYGGIDPISMPKGSTRDEFEFRKQTCFDILVINKNNQIRLFRVGAGEEKRDIEINYV